MPQQGVSVRRAVVTDAAALVGLYVQLAEDREAAVPVDPSRARQVLGSILEEPNRALLVASIDGAVIASADVIVVDNMTHGGRPWAMVENVVVDERHRGRGVGRALMERTLQHAREANCYKVQLVSLGHRTGAHAFYKSIGFQTLVEGFRLYLE